MIESINVGGIGRQYAMCAFNEKQVHELLRGPQPLQLSGLDLSWLDLRGIDLRRADLSGADLCGSDLRNANLSQANLHCANLSRADLSGANLSKADLNGANLFLSVLKNTVLTGTRVEECQLALAYSSNEGAFNINSVKRAEVYSHSVMRQPY